MLQSAEIQSVGLGDSLAKSFKKFGVTHLVEAVEIWTGRTPCKEKGEMSGCALRIALLNEIFSYNKTIRVRFLQDYVRRENINNSQPPVLAITFTAKAGDAYEIKKGHPCYNNLFTLAEKKILEEIN